MTPAGKPFTSAVGLAQCGARGVDLFFVISGFCLAYPALAAVASGRPYRVDALGYARFLTRRFSRIAPPYYVAIGLYAMLGLTAFGTPTGPAPHASALALLGDAAADAIFAPATRPVLDGSFWTLGFEVVSYVVCPFAVALYVRSHEGFALAVAGLYGLYLGTSRSIGEAGFLPMFMLGIVAADLAVRGSRTRVAFALLAPPALAVAIATQRTNPTVDHGDPLWAFAMFALVVAGTLAPCARVLGVRPLAAIGLASYSIYLVHQPILDRLAELGVSWPAAAAAGLGGGIAFFALVERPLVAPARRRALEVALGGIARRALRNSVVAERVFGVRGVPGRLRDAVEGRPAV